MYISLVVTCPKVESDSKGNMHMSCVCTRVCVHRDFGFLPTKGWPHKMRRHDFIGTVGRPARAARYSLLRFNCASIAASLPLGWSDISRRSIMRRVVLRPSMDNMAPKTPCSESTPSLPSMIPNCFNLRLLAKAGKIVLVHCFAEYMVRASCNRSKMGLLTIIAAKASTSCCTCVCSSM